MYIDTLISFSEQPLFLKIPLYLLLCPLCFLVWLDRYSGQNVEHRRQWIVDPIRYLSDVFSIEVAIYAI
jgi:hypothetical protein